ncbi:hypothetical protein FY528_04985 [Hymenobacter lutimineralis]|uniref:Lanthionine synthetase C family protein n=1 Tax=Hymenobacter lutimineralis TaxID=2606448 RepID=A0A5D6VBS8_9BACT|nr:lanthionine synthetase LanC family protein [Hymenobacter lutimineralis]TYZ12652.1 hypothetical protein FY528_04985 [Hymenobacter lutimineralis]
MSTPLSTLALIDTKLVAIAALLTRHPEQHLPTLMQGSAGIALFHAYLYVHTRDEHHLEHVSQYIEAAIEATNRLDQPPFLGTGFTGLGWVIIHLISLGVLDTEAATLIDDVRPLIIASLDNTYFSRSYDLFYGFIGTSLFLREDTETDHRLLQADLLQRLEQTAIPMHVGVAWNISLDNDQILAVSLGLAHGSPSIIMFLLGLHQQGVEPVRCRKLLDQAMAFLLSQEMQGEISLFPGRIVATQIETPSRLGWCYGDLGIAYVVLRVAAYFQDEVLCQHGLRIAYHAARRDCESAMVVRNTDTEPKIDISFIHGTAGIAFLFRRVFEITGEATFERRAQEWLALTLENVGPQVELLEANFSIKPFDSTDSETGNRFLALEQRFGLLEGLAGTGLVLTAFANPYQTGWAKLFLLHE